MILCSCSYHQLHCTLNWFYWEDALVTELHLDDAVQCQWVSIRPTRRTFCLCERKTSWLVLAWKYESVWVKPIKSMAILAYLIYYGPATLLFTLRARPYCTKCSPNKRHPYYDKTSDIRSNIASRLWELPSAWGYILPCIPSWVIIWTV